MPNKGYKQTEEHKRKTTKNLCPGWNREQKMPQMVGNTNGFKKGSSPWNKGLMGFMAGETNGRWRGGVSRDNKYKNMMQQKRRKLHPEKVRVMNNNRRLATSTLTIQTVQQVYEDNIKQYGTLTCYLCLQPILFGKDHLEHKTPLSRGGNNEYANLAIACQRCNCKKNTKTVAEYRKEVLIP